ncbi:MAG: 6-bladed beta-propeller [Gemmatimonadales bacterium]|jgi:hypothetical protein
MYRSRISPGCVVLAAAILLAAAAEASHAAQQLPSFSVVRGIGAYDAPEEKVFGEISDLAVGHDGTIFVLDGMSQQVRAFSREGAFLTSIGRPGKGPGEFTGARAMALDGEGALYVLDERLARISVLSPDRTLSYQRSVLIDYHATDLCFLGDRLFLVGRHEDGMIQELSPDGALLGSFGSLYEGANPLLKASLSLGFMLCASEAQLILAASPVLPLVRAYAPDGDLVWSATLPGFKATIIEERLDGSVRYNVGPDKQYHMLESLVYLPPGLVLAQAGLHTLGSGSDGEYEAISTWVLSAGDGSVVTRTDTLPLLKDIGGEYAYGLIAELYPVVTQYRFASREGR